MIQSGPPGCLPVRDPISPTPARLFSEPPMLTSWRDGPRYPLPPRRVFRACDVHGVVGSDSLLKQCPYEGCFAALHDVAAADEQPEPGSNHGPASPADS